MNLSQQDLRKIKSDIMSVAIQKGWFDTNTQSISLQCDDSSLTICIRDFQITKEKFLKFYTYIMDSLNAAFDNIGSILTRGFLDGAECQAYHKWKVYNSVMYMCMKAIESPTLYNIIWKNARSSIEAQIESLDDDDPNNYQELSLYKQILHVMDEIEKGDWTEE